MVYWIYNLILTLGLILLAPLAPLFFLLRLRVVDGFADRLSFYSRKVIRLMAGARPVWIHAVSAGEVLSMTSLVKEIRRTFPERKIMISSSTATGVEMASRIEGVDATIFFPLDHPAIVRRALDAFDPRLVIFLETEIWPNYLSMAHHRGIPVLLLSGRISVRSLRRYRSFAWLFGRAVRHFSVLGMQTEGDAERMISLGVDRSKIVITGNLKYDAAAGYANGNGRFSGSFLPERLKPRKLWVAGSTHGGEEPIVLDAHEALKRRFAGLILVLAPRHPHRFAEIEELLQKRGVRYVKKSQVKEEMSGMSDVVLLDSMGELPAFYALADAAFVGGSLINVGGHNILEPARLRKPVFFGPYMNNFSEAAAEIEQKGGGAVVRTKDDLVNKLGKVLADAGVAQAMGDLAHSVVDKHRGVVRESMQLLSRYLE